MACCIKEDCLRNMDCSECEYNYPADLGDSRQLALHAVWQDAYKILPSLYTPVLVCNTFAVCEDERTPVVGFLNDDGKWYIPWHDDEIEVTHWMPLPVLPNGM